LIINSGNHCRTFASGDSSEKFKQYNVIESGRVHCGIGNTGFHGEFTHISRYCGYISRGKCGRFKYTFVGQF